MDFVKITDDFVQGKEQQEQQANDIGFIENNKFYNSNFNSHSQNKRVFPPEKLLGSGSNNYNPIFIDKQKAEKKKVTYDDILSSLNMKVINGKLQIVRGDADAYSPPPQKPYNRNRIENVNIAPKNMNTPSHSYSKQNEFYKKFLQAQTQTQTQVVDDPLTPEEKKRLLMIQYIKHQQERQHISRVKSKKLNFV